MFSRPGSPRALIFCFHHKNNAWWWKLRVKTPIQCWEKRKNALNLINFPQNRTVSELGSGHRFLNPSQKSGSIFVTTTKINVSAENLVSVLVTKVEKSSLTFWLRRSEKSRKNPKLQDCQCLIPNGHNQLRVYPSATESGTTRWSHFDRRITSWGDPLGQIVKKVVKNSAFSRVTSIRSRNLKQALALQFDQISGIVGAHWHRLPSLVPICVKLVEKIGKTWLPKRWAKRQFFLSFSKYLGHLSRRVGLYCSPPL